MDEIITLQIEDVFPDPNNPRTEFAGIEELAANIAANGQLTAIKVRPDGDIHWIVSGERRWRAIKLNGGTTIKAIVENLDAVTTVTRAVAENDQRPLTDLEKSRGVQQMLATGVRPHDIAASSGESVERIERVSAGWKKWSAFAGDEPEQTSLERFEAIAEFDGDEEAQKAIMTSFEDLTSAKKNGAGYESVLSMVVDKLRRERDRKAAVAKCEAEIIAAGCEVIAAVGEDKAYLGQRGEAPEGAKWGRVANDGYKSAWVCWYGDAADGDTEADRERARKQEERDAYDAAHDAAHDARIAFLQDYFDGKTEALTDAIKKLAESEWEAGVSAKVSEIDEALTVKGLFPRFYAAILGALEEGASRVVDLPTVAWYLNNHGAQTVRYLTALKSEGYELRECETALIETIRANHPCPMCDGDGRPLCKDGSHNGNKVCDCGGTGVAS